MPLCSLLQTQISGQASDGNPIFLVGQDFPPTWAIDVGHEHYTMPVRMWRAGLKTIMPVHDSSDKDCVYRQHGGGAPSPLFIGDLVIFESEATMPVAGHFFAWVQHLQN